MAHQSPLVSFIARYGTMHGRFSSPVGRNIQRCAQWYASTVEDLLLRGPARNVVASCFRKSLTGDQLQTASLLQECVMVRDGLANLPDCFTACEMSDIASYLSTCWFSVSVSVSLSVFYFCTSCTISIVILLKEAVWPLAGLREKFSSYFHESLHDYALLWREEPAKFSSHW